MISAIPENDQAEKTPEAERRLLRRFLDLYERDRQLMACEIHDGPVQSMVGCLMHLESLVRLYANESPQAAKLLWKSIHVLEDGIAEARRFINGLKPPILDEGGIVRAIKHLVCKSRETHGPTIEFVHAVQFVRLVPPLEHALFRIVQESVSNTCRHSRSPRIQITLLQHGDRIHLEIRDWGVGFDPNAVGTSHFGLRGIRERARIMDGTASIDSAAGKGTCVTVELPVMEAFSKETR